MRIFGYPSADTQWSVVGGLKQRVEREFDGRYLTGQTRTGALMAASIGRNFTPRLQLAYVVRPRYVEVLPAVLRDLPSIATLFPALQGIGSEHELQHSAMLRALGSSVSYSFFGAEARHYWAFGPDVTLTWHAVARYMPSAGNALFWALSSLGGDRSVTAECEPLRG